MEVRCYFTEFTNENTKKRKINDNDNDNKIII